MVHYWITLSYRGVRSRYEKHLADKKKEKKRNWSSEERRCWRKQWFKGLRMRLLRTIHELEKEADALPVETEKKENFLILSKANALRIKFNKMSHQKLQNHWQVLQKNLGHHLTSMYISSYMLLYFDNKAYGFVSNTFHEIILFVSRNS